MLRLPKKPTGRRKNRWKKRNKQCSDTSKLGVMPPTQLFQQ